MPCCPTCVCRDEDFECLAVLAPERYPHFKAWCQGTDPAQRMLVRDLSSKGLQPQAERVMPVPVPDAAAAPSIPLAGDLVAAMTKRMGIDWVVKTVADELGVDCGCPERQQKLNALDARFRRFLGW